MGIFWAFVFLFSPAPAVRDGPVAFSQVIHSPRATAKIIPYPIMNAAQLLQDSLSPNQAARESATQQLEAAARDNFVSCRPHGTPSPSAHKQQTARLPPHSCHRARQRKPEPRCEICRRSRLQKCYRRPSMYVFLLTRHRLLTRHLQDAINQPVLSERWLALPESATNPLKHLSLSTLGSPQHRAGAVAAQCVSAIAAIELPVGKWPELIPQLLEFVQNQDNTGLRVNTLQAVGYICEVIVSCHDLSNICVRH